MSTTLNTEQLPSIDQSQSKRENKYPVLTLEKALDIINFFKYHGKPEGVSLTEICEFLDMKKSSVHRILNTLLKYNYIEHFPGSKKYRLSWELY